MGSPVAVIGCGYVGLTTGACLAHLGHDVTCADIDADRIARLEQGDLPIVEPGLAHIVAEGVDQGRLRFVLGAAKAVAGAEFVYLSVPTPMGRDGSADLSFINAAAREIGPLLRSEAVVINKSTVPVGSTLVVERALGRDDVSVVSNPEFLREGSAVQDFLHPDRIVIGASDQSIAIRIATLYLGISAPMIVTDPASAETIKYAANAFLATKISFVNALVCGMRGRRRRRERCAARARLRPADWFGISSTWSRVWRFLPPQGHPGSHPHRRGCRLRLRSSPGRGHRQRGAVRSRR